MRTRGQIIFEAWELSRLGSVRHDYRCEAMRNQRPAWEAAALAAPAEARMLFDAWVWALSGKKFGELGMPSGFWAAWDAAAAALAAARMAEGEIEIVDTLNECGNCQCGSVERAYRGGFRPNQASGSLQRAEPRRNGGQDDDRI